MTLSGYSFPSDGGLQLPSTTELSTFESCYSWVQQHQDVSSAARSPDPAILVLQCITKKFESENSARAEDLRRWLLVLAGSMVFFMQIGFAMLCAGCVRRKNVRNTMLKNLLDACGAAVAFYTVGYAFAFGGNHDTTKKTFIGNGNFFHMGDEEEFDIAFWFFQYTFSAASVTIVAGTLAERCQMFAYLCYSVFLTGFVYPITAHALWSDTGFLSPSATDPLNGMGAIDFAGSGVVHLTGGTTALAATYILGARKGRFYDSHGRLLAKPREFPGHSMALQLMGTLVLWFGWYGFNSGSALLLSYPERTGTVAALAAANTSLSGASGALCAMFTNLYMKQRHTGEFSFDITMAMNGALSGMVAITGGCGIIESWAAVCTGFIAGWIYMSTSHMLVRLKLDDAVDGIPVHAFNGAWGLISTGLFAAPRHLSTAYGTEEHVGLFYSFGRGSMDATLLLNQFVAVVFVVAWSLVLMLPFFIGLSKLGLFRTNALEEIVGLDMAYHGGKQVFQGGAAGEEGVTGDSLEAFRRQRVVALRKRKTSESDPSRDIEEGIGRTDDKSNTADKTEDSARASQEKCS